MRMTASVTHGLTWIFPPLNGGEEKGINDAGIETFHASNRLARETCQNIQDAHDPTAGSTAVAQFELLYIDPSDIPDCSGLSRAFDSAMTYCIDPVRHDPDAAEMQGLAIFRRAQSLLRGNRVPVLRIGDYRTTGLIGDDHTRDSPWYRLVRAQGKPKNDSGRGGTFGIGQRAPFSFSDLRTVLYSTRLPDGSVRFMGKSILCSHPASGGLTQNVGFLGTMRDASIASESDEARIPPRFVRAAGQPGTDIYVLGFERENWKDEIVRSLLCNFFGSILTDKLQVYILDHGSDLAITRAELPHLFEKYLAIGTKSQVADVGNARHFYMAMKEPLGGVPIQKTLPGLGCVELYVRRDPTAPRKVAYMRRPRILVYERANNRLANYAAVFLAEDDHGNKLLSGLENPEHSTWSVDQSKFSPERRREAEQALKQLREFVRESLDEIALRESETEEDLPGLPKELVIDDEPELGGRKTQLGGGSEEDDAGGLDRVPIIGAIPALPPLNQRAPQESEDGAGPGGGTEDDGAAGGGGQNDGRGGTRLGPGDDGGPSTGTHGGDETADRVLRRADVELRAYRVPGGFAGSYVLQLRALRHCSGEIRLAAVGDDSDRSLLRVLRVLDARQGETVSTSGSIRGLSMNVGERRRLEVVLDSAVPVCVTLG